MAAQAERIAEMAKAQAHLGANMADARRKAHDVHAARDALRKTLKTQLAEFGGVVGDTSSQVCAGRVLHVVFRVACALLFPLY